MKITEITSKTNKLIKRLQRLYTTYVLNPQVYSELVELITILSSINDIDLQREVKLIREKLRIELMEVLKK